MAPVAFLLAAFTAPLAETQQAGRTVTTGYPGNSSSSVESNRVDAFREGLRQNGDVAGPKLTLHDKRAAGRQERSVILAGELRDLDPAVILTADTSGTLKRPMRRQRWTESDWSSLAARTILLAVMVVPFLVCVGILVLASSRRRRRKLAKVLVPVVAGSVCGALWILLIDTAVSAAPLGATHEPAVLVVGVLMAALVMASLLWTPNALGTMVGLAVMAIGCHSLALPIAALISFVVGGARAGGLRTGALSVGGLLLGVFLVFVGDRILGRRNTSRPRARFDLSRPHA